MNSFCELGKKKCIGRKYVVCCLKVIIFVLIGYGLFHLYDNIFRYKYDECDSIKIFYELEENTVDVICFGSSHIFGAITPAVLWRDFGITTYDLCGPGMEGSQSYYYLKEALKTQKPKYVVFELGNQGGIASKETLSQYVAGMKINKNSFDLCRQVSEPKDFLPVFLRYPINHNRYNGKDFANKLTERDFLPYRGDVFHNSYKGNRLFINTLDPENSELYSTMINEGNVYKSDDQVLSIELTEDVQNYISRNIEYAQSAGIDVIYILPPRNRFLKNDLETISAMKQYISIKYPDVMIIDFNESNIIDEMKFDLVLDSADVEHVNYIGAEKVSHYLGKTILNQGRIEERRTQNKEFESWDRNLVDYESIIEDYELVMKTDQNLYDLLSYMENGEKYECLLYAKGDLYEEGLLEHFSGNVTILPENYETMIGRQYLSVNEEGFSYGKDSIGFNSDDCWLFIIDKRQCALIEAIQYRYDSGKIEFSSQVVLDKVWDKR